jgi:hypothetical protein
LLEPPNAKRSRESRRRGQKVSGPSSLVGAYLLFKRIMKFGATSSRLDIGPALLLALHDAHNTGLDHLSLWNERDVFRPSAYCPGYCRRPWNETSGLLNAIVSILSFTGEASARSMCRPAPKVITSILTFSPRSL